MKNIKAFTLVELLTVIVIIGILVSILMPTLGAARNLAKDTRTMALIRVLDGALEQFNSNERIGGQYPPSSGVSALVAAGNTITPDGAQLLVLAVAGYDLMGTPGFGAAGTQYDYALARSGPYCDLQSVLKPLNQIPGYSSASGAPVVVDPFGMPILYYRADLTVGGNVLTNRYNRGDNSDITNNAGGVTHSSFDTDDAKFRALFTDPTATSLAGAGASIPYKKDSYLLWSAGVDKIYGYKSVGGGNIQSDDNANFPPIGK